VAELTVADGELRLRLGRWEGMGALHRDVDVPVASLVSATAVADLWTELRGIRAPGTGVPGVVMLGTTRYEGVKDFCVVHGHGPGLVVVLRDQEFARLLVSADADRAAELAAEITALAVAQGGPGPDGPAG